MNKTFTISIVLLGAILVGGVWYVFSGSSTPVDQASELPTTLPSSGSVTPVSSSFATSSQSAQTMALATQSGTLVATNDFIHNGTTIPDTANPSRYLVAGNLGYCLNDPQKCQAGSAKNFNIYYNSAPQSFTIALTDEPIGQARLDMEQYLLTALGITQEQMCDLNYYVGVTVYVNSQFTGKNLGFSSCPGATVLPK